jgi:hypothetical protein
LHLRAPQFVLCLAWAICATDVVAQKEPKAPESEQQYEEIPPPRPEPFRVEAVEEPLLLLEGPFDEWSDDWGGAGAFDDSVVDGTILAGYPRWIDADALLWWMRGMDVPALLTTSPVGTAQAQAGVLGLTGTTTIFGGERLPDEMRFGGRIRYGEWLDEAHYYGLEWEYLGLEQGNASATVRSDGSTIYARPFFNALTNMQDAELVSFPTLLSGTADATVLSSFESSGVRLLMNLSETSPCDIPCGYSRWDFLLGYRYARLHDMIRINEDLTSLVGANPGTFDITDVFDTRNTFHGADLGLKWEGHHRDVTLQLLAKIGLGNNNQLVQIDGQTSTTVVGITTDFTGGLLAQRTNIGRFERDRFGVLPEFGLKLGWQISDRTRFTVGYSGLYWTNVVRAGGQIDSTVNPNLLPPEAVLFTGPLRPAFSFREVDFWAQGLDLGLVHQW